MEGVALISYEAIQNINTNIFFKFFICITLITFHFFLILKIYPILEEHRQTEST